MRIPGFPVTKYAKIAKLTLKHSNLPERYVRRNVEEIQYKSPNLPNYREITVKRFKEYYDVNRPWTYSFHLNNIEEKKKKKVLIQPIKDWIVFRGDRVEILNGKDKGKQGIVCEIIQERNWVFVKGLNTYLSLKGKLKNYPGVVAQIEAPLMVTTDIALVDPTDLKPTKVSWKYTETGERVRVSERTGKILPISILEEETYDYKKKALYKEQPKDTTAANVNKITFVPTLETFEMSLMREYGIEENRTPKKIYWY